MTRRAAGLRTAPSGLSTGGVSMRFSTSPLTETPAPDSGLPEFPKQLHDFVEQDRAGSAHDFILHLDIRAAEKKFYPNYHHLFRPYSYDLQSKRSSK